MSNINCINKDSTDYMFEDTAGRNLIGPEQATTTAVQAYSVGDLFWMNDALYRVTDAIASGSTITVGTNCVVTSVSAELANRISKSSTAGLVKNDGSIDATTYAPASSVNTKQPKTLDTPLTVEGDAVSTVEAALGKLNDKKAGLTDLAPAFDASKVGGYSKNDCVTYNGNVYRFNTDHTGAWVAADADQITVTEAGGHQMITATNDDTDVDAVAALTFSDASDEKVLNAYTVKKYSNCDVLVLHTTVASGNDVVGLWEEAPDDWTDYDPTVDDPLVYRKGWIWHEALYQILSGTNKYDYEIEIVFDIAKSETVGLAAYRVDDNVPLEVTEGGTTVTKYGGAVAIKFTGAVQAASGVEVGVKLIKHRTQVIQVTPL